MLSFKTRVSLVTICGLAFIAVFVQACGFGSRVTTGTQVYWGVYMDGVPWDMDKLKEFETAVNKQVSLVHWGQPWWHCYSVCGYQSFNDQVKQYDAVRLHGAIPLVDWSSWDYAADPVYTQPRFTLQSIIRGDHDTYIRQWATEAQQWGHPFFLRLNWEMNGNWYPWSEVRNGNRRGEYVQAWRHVHDIFTNAGATNVTWVWCVSVEYPNSLELEPLYPGDNYVDWVSMDGFNWAADRNAPWHSFEQVFGPTYQTLSKLAPTKPVMVAEVASTENRRAANPTLTKAAWIEQAFSETLPRAFPNIKAIAWFNWNEGNPNSTWEVNTTDSLEGFRRGISSGYYAGNIFAHLPDGPVRPVSLAQTPVDK